MTVTITLPDALRCDLEAAARQRRMSPAIWMMETIHSELAARRFRHAVYVEPDAPEELGEGESES